jgi:preprotein translocase subunit SecA
MEAFSKEVNDELLVQFKALNKHIECAASLNKKPAEERLSVDASMESLQQVLGFKLYSSQVLCINYLMSNPLVNHLVHFGIGNGKTLLCISLAVLLANKLAQSVFIVSKNEHLVQRDFKKYQRLIKSMNLNANLNFCAK